MTESFDQILELIKKTGDRCVVIDRASQNSYVVMPIKDYERLAVGGGMVNQSKRMPRASVPLEEVLDNALVGTDIDKEIEDPPLAVDSSSAGKQTPLDWWEEETEPLQPLDEKSADDQYYLEPVES